MKINDILLESIYSRPLVVVDVQPAYSRAFNFEDELAQFINKRTGETVMYVNAYEDSGTTDDTLHDIYHWWYEAGMQEDTIEELTWIDKGYGYLREAIDSGADDSDIVAVIREMYNQHVTDSRELFDGDTEQQMEAFGEDNMYWIEAGISVEWIELGKLKALSPFYICGGGKDECLKEVLLMCNALNIKYKIIDKFVY